ncbi:MAG: NosD domain-containing protein, partial [Candidatus Aenigmatarchaeota archaeon]
MNRRGQGSFITIMPLVVVFLTIALLAFKPTALAPFQPSAPPGGISSCQNITSAGYYYLTQSISGLQAGRDVCIDIQANNVVFTCSLYNITGSGSGKGVYAQGRTSITIRDCPNISMYATGIYLDGTNYSTISNSGLFLNPPPGGGGASGLHLSNSNFNNITNVTANNNDYGIYLSTSSNNTLTNNTVYNNTQHGIYLSYSSNNNLTNNTARS